MVRSWPRQEGESRGVILDIWTICTKISSWVFISCRCIEQWRALTKEQVIWVFPPLKGPLLFPSSIILLCFQRMVLGFYGSGDTVVQDSTSGLQGSRFRILLSRRTSKESTWIIWWVSGEGQMIDDHEGLKQGTASTTIVEVEEEAGLSCEKAEPKPSYSLNPSPPLPLVLQLQKSSQRWVDFCRCSHLYIWFFFLLYWQNEFTGFYIITSWKK